MAQQTPAAKKTSAAKQTAAGKVPAKGATAKPQAEEERYRMITEAAYLIAEKRGFEGDRALDDWLQAEAEVDARFAARH